MVLELSKYYKHSLQNQWGFHTYTNTECAIPCAVNTIRKHLPYAAVLDLRKSYDCVPRGVLQGMLDASLPTQLSIVCRPFLSPMQLRTKGHRSRSCLSIRAVMPKCDPPSPLLFNIFMGSLIRKINGRPSRGLVILFVDDLLALS